MTARTDPWPLLHIAELADVCHRCARRPATWTDRHATNWCAACWNAETTRCRPRRRADLLDELPPDGVTLRCGYGLHHACPSCACRCHDPQPELPLDDPEITP